MVLKYSTPHKCKFSVAEVKTTNDKSKGIVEPTTIMIANFGQLDQDPPVHKQLRNQREKVDDYHEPSIVKHLNGLIKSLGEQMYQSGRLRQLLRSTIESLIWQQT